MTPAPVQLIQASGVEIAGRGLIIEGRPGSGKSTLALELIDRGNSLIGDDGLRLESRDHSLIATPPPNIAGKLEIRGLGIFELPAVSAPVALILNLDAKPERLPDTLETREIMGVTIPVLPFDPTAPATAIRAEWALGRFGLSRFGS